MRRLFLAFVAAGLMLVTAAESAQAGPFGRWGWFGTPYYGVSAYPYYYSSAYYVSPSYYTYPRYVYYPTYMYSYPAYSYSYTYPSYSSVTYVPTERSASYYAPSEIAPASSVSVMTNQDDRQALLRVRVPREDARVWIENAPMRQGGTDRLFNSPPLDPGKDYSYTVRASWMANGQEVVREKEVRIRAGQQSAVNFVDDRGEPAPLPRNTNDAGKYPDRKP